MRLKGDNLIYSINSFQKSFARLNTKNFNILLPSLQAGLQSNELMEE